MIRHHNLKFALGTIHKILVKNGVNYLKRKSRRRKKFKRYEKETQGESVQIDVFKVGPGKYQFTAIDDCTRYRVHDLQPRKNAKATLRFLDKVQKEMPFPIQRIQSDRGREFMADEVQYYLMDSKIKFSPNKLRSPHLNGKVEGSQKTDWDEFYSYTDTKSEDLSIWLKDWHETYNHLRPQSALRGRTPREKLVGLQQIISSKDVVEFSQISSEQFAHLSLRFMKYPG